MDEEKRLINDFSHSELQTIRTTELRDYPKSQQRMLKTYNRSIISEHPSGFAYCVL